MGFLTFNPANSTFHVEFAGLKHCSGTNVSLGGWVVFITQHGQYSSRGSSPLAKEGMPNEAKAEYGWGDVQTTRATLNPGMLPYLLQSHRS